MPISDNVLIGAHTNIVSTDAHDRLVLAAAVAPVLVAIMGEEEEEIEEEETEEEIEETEEEIEEEIYIKVNTN